MNSVMDKIDEDIEKYGRSVMMVFPTGDSDPINDSFAYTIGNWRHGFPELVYIGTYKTGPMLNVLSDLMINRNQPFRHGEIVRLEGARCPVCIIKACEDVKNDYTVQATNKIGRSGYEVMQVVGPDLEGRFPWEDGCEHPYCDVLLYGSMRQRDRQRFERRKANA